MREYFEITEIRSERKLPGGLNTWNNTVPNSNIETYTFNIQINIYQKWHIQNIDYYYLQSISKSS